MIASKKGQLCYVSERELLNWIAEICPKLTPVLQGLIV